jgi:putative ABC transport system permease protein
VRTRSCSATANWQDALGADPSVVGGSLVVNGKPLTIVGVAPPEFQGMVRPLTPDVFVPITFRWRDDQRGIPNFDDRRNYWVYLFARLKPGVSMRQAEAAINGPYRAILNDVEAPLQTGMPERVLERFREKTVTVTSGYRGQSVAVSGARVPLAVLLVAAAAVLLIACVNIANLMLARGATRVGQMAVRLSMGAAPRRLVTLLFTESALLALLAVLVSLPLTQLTLRWIEGMVPAEGAASFDFGVNGRVVGISVVVALASALVFALFPALKLARTQPGAVLHLQSARATGGRAARSFRVTLVTAQVALSMVLLVLAGLLARSLTNIAQVDLGIHVESLMSFAVSPERNGYTPEQSAALFDRIETELAAAPGVASVASSLVTLLSDATSSTDIRAPGFEPSPGTRPTAYVNGVSPGFFGTLEIPLVAGRDFRGADMGLDRPRVAIVNERFVERFGLGANPVGAHIGVGGGEALDVEIIGVARDVKYDSVKDPVRAQLFRPRAQIPRGTVTFYVRNAGDPEAVAAAIRGVVARLDPSLPIMDLRTVDRQVQQNVFLDLLMSKLVAAFAALATLLAALGLYGLLSYLVAERTREIGLRFALGAPPARLRGMVLRQVSGMVLTGGVIGLAAALVLGQAVSALLFGVKAWDPLVLIVATSVFAAISVGAGYLPARRAARVDPMVALRSY